MADNDLLEIYKQHSTGENKYTYFMLAVGASAIAFSVEKTTGLKLSWSMLPLGMAVICWGVSFYCGCKNVHWVQISILANYNLLQLQKGVHEKQPNHPQLLEVAISKVNSALESNINNATLYAKWQFNALIIGAGFFLVWHIMEMIIRTIG